MDVRCERCKTEYELDDARVTEAGIPVKCASCSHVFRVKKKALFVTVPLGPNDSAEGVTTLTPQERAAERPAEKPREWRIRQTNGTQATLRELTTLQRWIVEHKVVREDEISATGESWKRLGDIPELSPFFEVLDRALAGTAAAAPVPAPLSAAVFDEPPTPAPPAAEAPAEAPTSSAFTRGVEGLRPLDADALAHVGGRPGSLRLGPLDRGPRAPSPSREDEDLDEADEASARFTQGRRTGVWVVGGLLLGVAALTFWVMRAKPGEPPQSAPARSPQGRILSRTAADPYPAPEAAAVDAAVAVAPAPEAPAVPVPPVAEAAPKSPSSDAGDPAVEAPVPLATSPATPPAAVTPPPTPAPTAPVRRTAAFRDYDGYIAQGDRLRERDRAKGALDAYEKAIELSPERAEGYAGRGLALLDLGKREQAEAAFLQALRFNGRYGVAIMGLAETYRVQNRKDEALKHYQRYLEVAPTGMEASAARAAIQKLRE